MVIKLRAPQAPLLGNVHLPISKSIANRYQIIGAIAGNPVGISDNFPDDVLELQKALSSSEIEINVGMAGTAMRFLTAYFATKEGRVVSLTGNSRMQQRPIAELVEALSRLGADISYLNKEGYPPLRINGRKLKGGRVELKDSVSSQFISALMMIGPTMETGLELSLKGKVLSKPYIELTTDCMRKCGVEVNMEDNTILVRPGKYCVPELEFESDWTAASYFYALVAAKPKSKLLLRGLKLNSIQGDSILSEWFKPLGVSSIQTKHGVEISSSGFIDFPIAIDFIDHPDLAQTFAFLAAVLEKEFKLTGLDNLRLKETDRIAALKTELEKLGIAVSVEGSTMTISGSISVKEVNIRTYNDHRMAMSAAVLSAILPTTIENPKVVSKSFPEFWKKIRSVGLQQI